MSSPIPIQNIYYLLCYAWDQWRAGGDVDVGTIEAPELVDLLAHVLVLGTRRVLRRGLDRGYLEHDEVLPAIRGKLDVGLTMKRMLLQHGRAHCRFDELSLDVLHNRILRTTIGRLARLRDLDRELRSQLQILYRQLDPIQEINLTRAVFKRVQLHRNNASYDLLMRICEMLHQSQIVEPGSSVSRFREFVESNMPAIYEEFIRNFYRREQRRYHVSDDWIDWDGAGLDERSTAALPRMHTDITLASSQHVVIIDAKYYNQTLSAHYDVEKVHSPNLYQLFAYLKNAERRGGAWTTSEGMLLYPVVTRDVNFEYAIQGHRVRVCTLNLNQPWRGVHHRLMELIGDAVTDGTRAGTSA